MELGGQIKKHRDALGFSQEELAEKVFVTRQSISNWETGKTYPDLQSLLRLGSLFGLSLDELIKGDMETMKEIDMAEVKRLDRYGGVYAVCLFLTVLAPAPLLIWLDLWAIAVFLPLLGVDLVLAFRIERIKKENDIHTYREIVAFSEGKRLDQLEKAREEGKRPYQAVLLALGSGCLTLAVAALLFRLLGG